MRCIIMATCGSIAWTLGCQHRSGSDNQILTVYTQIDCATKTNGCCISVRFERVK